MAGFQEQKERALGLFDAAGALARRLENRAIEERLQVGARRLSDGKLVVVVCGEFKQGKSSLINALLGDPGLFPVDVDITTNLVSTISYGEKEKVSVLLGERGKEEAEQIERDRIWDYVTEQHNQGNPRKARMLVIEAPNPVLRDGLVLVDTPGVGWLNREHAEITYAFIPNADVLLFVSDALAPFSSAELDFVRMASHHCQNILVAVTKIDIAQDYRAVVDNDRAKLAEVLGRSGEEVAVLPVSSQGKLQYLQTGDSEDLADSNFPALEQELWRMLGERRGQILLAHALAELGRDVRDMRAPLQAEWEGCQQRSRQEQEVIERHLQEARLRLQKMQEGNAAWRIELAAGLQNLRKRSLFRFEERFDRIESQTSAYLDDSRLLSEPQQIGDLLHSDINGLMADLSRLITEQAAELHARAEESTGLKLNPFQPVALNWEESPPRVQDGQAGKIGLLEKTLTSARTAVYTVPIGGVVFGLIGGAIGGVIGALFGGVGAAPGAALGQQIGMALGGVAGFKTGLDQGLSQLNERSKREVSKVILPFVKRSHLLCRDVLDTGIGNLEQSIRDELNRMIAQEREACEASLRSYHEARKLSQEEAARRALELAGLLEKLSEIHESTGKLAALTMRGTVPSDDVETMPPPSSLAVQLPLPKTVDARAPDLGDWADG